MELIFVYNADSGGLNQMIGALHKMVHPSSYSCDLCKITHHATGERQAWKIFLKTAAIPVQVMYRNEFHSQFSEAVNFPAIFFYDNSRLTCILDKKELAAVNDLEELFVLIKGRLPVNVEV